ncbi:MAG: hypothetical protein U5O39_15000 [Gammaproteobacteria bacterium]|nr:hypothetical protein [Gammaproteobacteria bacterium]
MHLEDNRTIFNEIIAERADVMITDAIEVRLKAYAHEELCAAMPGETFTDQGEGLSHAAGRTAEGICHDVARTSH